MCVSGSALSYRWHSIASNFSQTLVGSLAASPLPVCSSPSGTSILPSPQPSPTHVRCAWSRGRRCWRLTCSCVCPGGAHPPTGAVRAPQEPQIEALPGVGVGRELGVCFKPVQEIGVVYVCVDFATRALDSRPLGCHTSPGLFARQWAGSLRCCRVGAGVEVCWRHGGARKQRTQGAQRL